VTLTVVEEIPEDYTAGSGLLMSEPLSVQPESPAKLGSMATERKGGPTASGSAFLVSGGAFVSHRSDAAQFTAESFGRVVHVSMKRGRREGERWRRRASSTVLSPSVSGSLRCQ